MALDWTRHADALADIDERAFTQRFAAEIADLVAGFPKRASWEVVADALALHRRHGGSVRTVLAAAVRNKSRAIMNRTLPATCLLRMMVAERAGEPALPDTTHRLVAETAARGIPTEAEQAPSRIFPLRVSLACADEGPPRVTVRGLGSIVGAPARVVRELKPYHDEDCARHLPPESHRFIPPGYLAASKPAVSQNVRRCRVQLAEYL